MKTESINRDTCMCRYSGKLLTNEVRDRDMDNVNPTLPGRVFIGRVC